MSPLLSVRGLTLRRDDGQGSAIINDLNLYLNEGEVVIIKGESGSGKTSLLKCMAELTVYQSGEILLNGKSAREYGVPNYRTKVQYIPQRPSLLPGTPIDFLNRIQSFASRQNPSHRQEFEIGKAGGLDPYRIAEEWGIDRVMWGRDWSTLSGGEGQRIALAIAIGVGRAEVVLLDEPTSALDEETMKKVEKTLLSLLPPSPHTAGAHESLRKSGNGPKAYLWITHEGAQAERCGTRQVDITRQ